MTIYEILRKYSIVYQEYTHQAVYTCEEADIHCAHIPGKASKNLFLRNEKGNNHYLVVMKRNKTANLKMLTKILHEKGLSFASEKRLQKFLGVTPGSVTPFGLINDLDKKVIVIIDKDLLSYTHLQYHPNKNTATLVISAKDLIKFINLMENKTIMIDFK